MKETKFSHSFTADTPDGRIVVVEVYMTTDIGKSNLATGQRNSAAELGYLKTKDGKHVNLISKGKYQIVDEPMVNITSDDPKAP